MVCSLLSDLHLEEHPDGGEAYLDSLDPEGVDLLVLAGDICSHDMISNVLSWFSKNYNQIVYVLGNHEYHESSFEDVKTGVPSLKNGSHSTFAQLTFYSIPSIT